MSNYIPEITRKRALSIDDSDAPVFKSVASSPTTTVYKVNDIVLCLWEKEYYYEAKITGVEDTGYKICYPGWGKNYDEFISNEEALKRFKSYNEEENKATSTNATAYNVNDKILCTATNRKAKIVDIKGNWYKVHFEDSRNYCDVFIPKEDFAKLFKPYTAKETMPPSDTPYNLDDRILCLCDDGQTYEAKIISVEHTRYKIHYHRWDKKYDEFIFKKDAAKRFKPYTDKDAREAKAAYKEALQQAKKQEDAKKQGKPKIKAAKRKHDSTLSAFEKRKKSPIAIENLDISMQETYVEIPDSDLQDVLENLLTEGLARVLLEENNKISDFKAVPKVLVECGKSIEKIFEQYLKSKGYKVDKFEASIKSTKDFKSAKFDLQMQMVFFADLFNKRFMQCLVYEEEKDIYDFGKINSKNDSIEEFTRHSACLGFTHLIRFIHYLPWILMAELIVNELVSEASNFASTAQDLCDYLEKNISMFYDEQAYYESNN